MVGIDVFFLAGLLFLGWSLGANDAANVFGSAVGSKIISYRKAIILCAVFVIIGSTLQGSATTGTIKSLGVPVQMQYAFIITLSSAICVFWMSYLGLPVSTTQAIVGAIVGWNIFSHTPINLTSLVKIVMSWITSPLLAALLAIPLYHFLQSYLLHRKMHVMYSNVYMKWGLILTGIFGSYSLGANNIGNVVGAYAQAFQMSLSGGLNETLTYNILLFIGGASIALGVLTYSKKTMLTVGKRLLPLTPEAALIAVLAHSIVLVLFSSHIPSFILSSLHLPALPPVPVSSSQAIIGAIIGIGISRGGSAINYKIVPAIALGWLATPLLAAILCWCALQVISFI